MPANDPSQTPLSRADTSPTLLSGYQPLAQIHDELLTPEGALRPHWKQLIDAFEHMGVAEIERRFGFADRHLRDNGVVHRIYDTSGGAERPLPLSHVPLLISQQDWADIEAAVVQRAELINLILADIYGAQTLIKAGHLPAALVAGNPEFLRPMVGVEPAGGSHLLYYAVDIGRGPDGKWWVLHDLTESPPGAGYTVENRIALSRALPELYQPLHVRRLARFFGAFRDFLNSKSAPGRRVGVLSAGSYNANAFEHAYLARYLGFLLFEGEDLVVRDDRLYASVTDGLQPVDVLLRKLDADFADPLMFNSSSWIGTPGLALAAQAGNVVIANALGSGVAEATGLLRFLPQLARVLLNEDLKFPSVATWWCGSPDEQAEVIADFAKLVIAPAFGPVLPGLLDEGAVHIGDLDPKRRDQIAAAIKSRGIDLVAQEAVHLSTMPVWRDGHLEPRPFMLRVYAARTEDGWQVMPGGFCQVSASVDPRAVSLQRGSSLADVWVMGDKPDGPITLLSAESSALVHRGKDVLPTRTAENLFWLARYLERAENCTRMIRAFASRQIGLDTQSDAVIPLLAKLMSDLGALPAGGTEQGDSAVKSALSDASLPGGLRRLMTSARACASKARDQISADAWTVLNDLTDLVDWGPEGNVGPQEALELCNEVLRQISAFAGLAGNNMNRLSGWRFLRLGGCIERSMNIALLTRALGDVKAPAGGFEALLELADSQISFGMLYSNAPTRPQIVDLVLLDANNPRSLAYQIQRVEEHMKHLPEVTGQVGPSLSRKLAIRVAADVRVLSPQEASSQKLSQVIKDLSGLSDAVAADFFVHLQTAAPVWEG